MAIDIKIDESHDLKIANSIKQGVIDFNKPFLGEWKNKFFSVYAEEQGKIIGGISGAIMNKYMRVEWVWVDENYRSKRLGSALFKKLEDFARKNQCKFIQLDTFDFQARPFYEKLGFVCIGTIPKWIDGHDDHFLRKTL